MSQVQIAFLMTLLAGLATGIGSCIAFFAKKTNTKFLAISLGFSAGVMIYVSMIEIFPQAQASLTKALGVKAGNWATAISFFGGMAVIALIDKLIPSSENPHEVKRIEDISEPIGAVVGYLLLRSFLNDALFGIVFAGVAGIMVFISLDELLPSAREYGEHHLSIYGLIGGMIVMAISLLLFI